MSRANVVRGQYAAGAIDGKEVIAYREEDRVNPQSMTETYVALKVNIDNWRWAGVPFYIRVGKRLPKGGTEIAIQFKHAPSVLFNTRRTASGPNVLVIRIQPDEGISLRMQCKMPGAALRIEPVKMDFHYGTSFGKASPGSLRAPAARRDERRRHALRPARRSGGRVALHRPHRGRLAPESEPAAALRISLRLVGPEGSRRSARARRAAPGGGL